MPSFETVTSERAFHKQPFKRTVGNSMCLRQTSLGFLLQHEPQYRTDSLCHEHAPVLLVMRGGIETRQDDRVMGPALALLPFSSHP